MTSAARCDRHVGEPYEARCGDCTEARRRADVPAERIEWAIEVVGREDPD